MKHPLTAPEAEAFIQTRSAYEALRDINAEVEMQHSPEVLLSLRNVCIALEGKLVSKWDDFEPHWTCHGGHSQKETSS